MGLLILQTAPLKLLADTKLINPISNPHWALSRIPSLIKNLCESYGCLQTINRISDSGMSEKDSGKSDTLKRLSHTYTDTVGLFFLLTKPLLSNKWYVS